VEMLELVATPVWEVLQASAARPALLVIPLVMPLVMPLVVPLVMLLLVLLARETLPPRPTPARRGTFSTTPFLSPPSAKATATPSATAARGLLRLQLSVSCLSARLSVLLLAMTLG
jgi:hypothetical protein